jgi:diguanylate cyclase (GGDEF)-like protein
VGIVIDFVRAFLIALLGFSGIVGLLALISPKVFASVASYGSRNILTGQRTQVSRWFDIDQYALANGRLFGLAIIVSEGLIWYMSCYGPEAYSKSFLVVIVCIGFLGGILALSHILRQKRDIESKLAEAHTDALTELPNRRAFEVELSRRLAQRQRQGTPFCLQIIDVDKFKSINDTFGHPLGDAVLKEVAKVLTSTARQMDIVARLGGDEFVILLPETALQEACYAAERIRTACGDKPLCLDGHEHKLTVSSGTTEAQVDDDAGSLFKRADSALYAAKEAGRNCCFQQAGPEKATVEPAVAQAIRTNEDASPAVTV